MALKSLVVAGLASLAACTPEVPVSGPETGMPAYPSRQVREERGIQGEYIVKFIDGAPPVINIEGHEPTITIGAERIHFQSQCIYADWTYKRNGEAIATKSEPGGDMCARALAPGETAIGKAFDSPEIIRRIRSGLYFEGGGHRLQLQRKVDPAEIALRAVDLAGKWRVVALDSKDIADPSRVALSADYKQIWWEPECALQYRAYTIKGDRFDTAPVSLSEQAVCDIALPQELTRIWSTFDAADTIARNPADQILISGSKGSVTMRRIATGPQ